jgi:hypothetical protein
VSNQRSSAQISCPDALDKLKQEQHAIPSQQITLKILAKVTNAIQGIGIMSSRDAAISREIAYLVFSTILSSGICESFVTLLIFENSHPISLFALFTECYEQAADRELLLLTMDFMRAQSGKRVLRHLLFYHRFKSVAVF